MAGALRRISLAVGLVILMAGLVPQLTAVATAQPNETVVRGEAAMEGVSVQATQVDASAATAGNVNISSPRVDTAASIANAAQIASAPAAPLASGRVIYVSRARQWVYAYSNGRLAFSNAVETGQSALPTPSGHYSVLRKGRNLTFTSPWPKGSPYYYNPTHINYALLFKSGGFYLHDAWWHCTFGPGGNVSHWTAGCPGWTGGHWETGSHGCVGMTISNARRLYDWAAVGTPVIVS